MPRSPSTLRFAISSRNTRPVCPRSAWWKCSATHKLSEPAREALEAFFTTATVLAVTDPVLQQAIKLRQVRKMTLGDSLVAATAIVHGQVLVTRNTKDFDWITGLQLLNPFEPHNGPASPPG